MNNSEYGTLTTNPEKKVKKLLITNVVYGDIYAQIWLEQHLKSLLDDSNIPAHKDRVEYMVFSDDETIAKLGAHENYKRLQEFIPVTFHKIVWPEQEIDRFGYRYNVLMSIFKASVTKAIEKDYLLSAIVADLVFARHFLTRVFDKIDKGHDSVFVQPPRCAAEVVMGELNKYPRAMHAEDLWKLCYDNLHPLWVAAHWNASQFTKLPFSMLWNTGSGLLVRSFSITPIVLTPYPSMTEGRGMIDGEIPKLCKNPYWAKDWTDAPVVGVEPLFCYYPPFANHTATTKWVKEWTACLHPSQSEIVKQRLYYPDKDTAAASESLEAQCDQIIKEII